MRIRDFRLSVSGGAQHHVTDPREGNVVLRTTAKSEGMNEV